MLTLMWPFRKRRSRTSAPDVSIASVEVYDGNGELVSREDGPREPMSDERFEQIVAEIEEDKARRAQWASMRFVRGMSFEDAADAVDQLKREGKLEEALDLAYACSDAMERANAIIGVATAGSWYKRQAIILRKMGDYEAEVRLIEDLQRRFPDKGYLRDRLKRARELEAKSGRP